MKPMDISVILKRTQDLVLIRERQLRDLTEAVKVVIPDLQHYVSTHGAGPDNRLAALELTLSNIEEET